MKMLINQPEFRAWIERSLKLQKNILAISNQGTLLKFRGEGRRLVVKAAMGKGLAVKVRQRTLLREHQAYTRMEGVPGVPACHGLVDGRYLVIDFIEAIPYRQAEWKDRERWFEEFLEVIRSFHARGVSHGDLKSKSNILVTAEEKPCVIDFGTAIMHKPGLHPVNNGLFEHGRRMDVNAWVKHKYHGKYEDAKGTDLDLLDYSHIEYYVRKFRGRPTGQIPRKKRKKKPG